MTSESRKIYCVPRPVRPSMLPLEILAKVSAVDLETEIGVDGAGVYRDEILVEGMCAVAVFD